MKLLTVPWKAHRMLFRVTLGKLFYQSRVDKDNNPILLRPFWGKLNQRLIENGYTPPWIMTRQQYLDFWSSKSSEFSRTRPDEYASKSSGITQLLHDFWRPQVTREDHILELGCGFGGNLNHLYRLGYTNLLGIEINQSVIDEMGRVFPELITHCQISIGSLEDLLPEFATHSVDVIFTVALATVIHPTSNVIFQEMSRIARKYIVLIELEAANCSYIFARNYRRLFHNLGSPQLKSVMITKEAFPGVSSDYYGCTARLFDTGKHHHGG